MLEIPFKDDGKVSGKKLNSFYNKDVFDQVKEFKRGDRVEVDIEKEAGSDGKEYWQWKAVRPVSASTGPVGAVEGTADLSTGLRHTPQGDTKAPGSRGKVLGSTYETPEERALKQVLIVRQSSLSAALSYIKLVDNGVAGLSDLFEIAEDISEWVFDAGRLTPPALNVEEALVPDIPTNKPEESKQKRRAKAEKAVADLEDDIPF